MRKLKTSDVPAACRALKRMGIKDKIQNIARTSDTTADAWTRGFDLIWDVFDMATEAEGENELYKFLAGPFEKTPQEMADLPLPELIDGLKQLAEENDLAAFFKAAGALMR